MFKDKLHTKLRRAKIRLGKKIKKIEKSVFLFLYITTSIRTRFSLRKLDGELLLTNTDVKAYKERKLSLNCFNTEEDVKTWKFPGKFSTVFFSLNLSWIYGCLSVLVSTECVYEISYD